MSSVAKNSFVQSVLRVAILLSFVALPWQSRGQVDEGLVPDDVEFMALRDLYQSTNGASWANNAGWPTDWTMPVDNTQFGSWFGVQVSQGDINQIVLSSNHLVGPLPESIATLTGLVTLDLSYNSLTGTMPVNITNLKKLAYFYFQGQAQMGEGGGMTGPLPSWTGLDFPALQYLDFSYNLFSGAFPDYSNFQYLVRINLNANQLTGEIPESYKTNLRLQEIRLGSNAINGPIPAWLGEITTLYGLDLASCGLTGSIPAELGYLTKLTYLYLHYNQLSGQIPASLNNCTDMGQLYLDVNELEGPLPDLSALKNMWQLAASHNNFSGPIPAWLGSTNIAFLGLGYNNFSGDLPPEIANMSNLVNLWLSGNQITGPLPDATKFRNMSYFDLSYNLFEGEIPASYVNLPAVTTFDVRGNRLHGPMPPIGNWKNVQSIMLADNNLSGAFPSVTGLNNLLMIEATRNRFTSLNSSVFTAPLLYYVSFQLNNIAHFDGLVEGIANNSLGAYRPTLFLSSNYVDYALLEPLISVMPLPTNSRLDYYPQRNFDDVKSIPLQAGNPLKIPARGLGQYGSITWYKEIDGSWQDVTATNESASPEFFERTVATEADSGRYYWAMTSSQYPEVPLQSNLIHVSDTVTCDVGRPQILPSSTPPICSTSDAVTLRTFTRAGNTYQWYKDGVPIAGATDSSYVPTGAGKYQIEHTFGTCLSISDTLTIRQGVLAPINLSGAHAFCAGDSAAVSFHPHPGMNYQWLNQNVPVAQATDSVLIVRESSALRVVQMNGLCSDTTAVHFVTALPKPLPIAQVLGDTLLWTGQKGTFVVQDTANIEALVWKIPAQASIQYKGVYQETGILSFNYPGKYTVLIQKRLGSCLGEAYSLGIQVQGSPLAVSNIPEALKTGPTHSAAKQQNVYPVLLSDVGQEAKPVFEGCLTDRYYVGFQLQYDLSDHDTKNQWSAFLQVSLLQGDDTLWTKPLQVDMPTQTFISTVFHDTTVACTEDYRFVVNRKVLTGNVPESSIYLRTLLYQVPSGQFDPAAAVSVECYGSGFQSIINWNYSGSAASEYDLEWVFISEHDTTYLGTTGPEAFDYKEAAGVTVKTNSYAHQYYYTAGTIFYRVRAISYNPLYPEHRILGEWFYSNCINGITTYNHEPTINWQAQVVYAEEGKNKKVMNYFDGSLRQRQSKSNLSTEDLAVQGETYYDFEGRPSVNMIAVPTFSAYLRYDGPDQFNYFEPSADSVIASRTSEKQTKFHYDNYRIENSVMGNLTGASRYYSSNNAGFSPFRPYVPHAEGYVYSQTEYTRDGTGRIARQSGVGKTFAIDGDHTTRYYYAEAAQHELIRLFGSNVGESSHYKKNLVVDPNGQVSVSYIDQEGRTIATALAGDPPANVDSLQSFKDLLPLQDITVSLNNKNKKDITAGTSITSQKIANVSPNSLYTFRYDLSALGSEISVFGCRSCVFDLKFIVTDPDGRLVALDTTGSDSQDAYAYERRSITVASCTAPGGINNLVLEVLLKDIGEYTITKTLQVHDISYDQMLTDIKQVESVQATLQQVRYGYSVDADNCAVCSDGPKAEEAIEQAIQEIAQLDCENIYQQIIQSFQKTDSLYVVPDDSITSHPLYCKYTACIKDKESDMFEKRMARVKGWRDAVASGYANALEIDPFFNNPSLSGAGSKGDMEYRLQGIDLGMFVFDYDQDGTPDGSIFLQGQLTSLINPMNRNFYVNEQGIPDQNGSAHILYLDLMKKRNTMSAEDYDNQLDFQHWILYKSQYLEQKRKLKLMIYDGCVSLQEELYTTSTLPQEPEEIEAWAKDNGLGNDVSDQEVDMAIEKMKMKCGNTDFAPADAQAMAGHLRTYFNSNRKNFFRLFLKNDWQNANASLTAINNLLATYGCGLDSMVVDDPLMCVADTTITVSQYMNTFMPVPRPANVNAKESRQTDPMMAKRIEEEGNALRDEVSTLSKKELPPQLQGKAVQKQSRSRSSVSLASVDDERNALIAMYTNMAGNLWTRKLNWNTSSPLSSWQGVVVNNDGHVIELHLGNNNIQGNISSQIGNLIYLEYLDMSLNGITGGLPSTMQNLQNLKTLNLTGCYMSGSFPTWISSLTQLTSLLLDFSRFGNIGFSGVLPNFSTLSNLVHLNLSGNKLTGAIPASIGSLTKLESLLLGNNKLTGAIPSEIGALVGLKKMDLSLNSLTGELPGSMASLINLEDISLNGDADYFGNAIGNDFTGSIPAYISTFVHLEYLDLHGNSFSGTIPGSFSQLVELSVLRLDNNELSGTLPAGLGSLSQLTDLSLSRNALTGPIPSDFGSLNLLQYLDLSHNQLSGNVPSNFGNLPSLKNLVLDNNQLTGTLPATFTSNSIYQFRVANNLFEGTLPNLTFGISKYLDISNNRFSGPLTLPNIGLLAIEGNLFSFSDLVNVDRSNFERSYTGHCDQSYDGECVSYLPQDSVDVRKAFQVNVGSSVTLEASVDREVPTVLYQWFRYVNGSNDVAMNQESSSSHTLNVSVSSGDNFYYYYTIRNVELNQWGYPAGPSDLLLVSRMQNVRSQEPPSDKTYETCFGYDTANATIKQFTYQMDWNKYIEQCIANEAKEDSLLVDMAIEKLMDDYATEYYNTYRTKCINSVKENLNYTYTLKEYHYTLYYYDQAKNLVQTVPPAGVNPLSPTAVTAFINGNRTEPAHKLITRYQYSALNQLIWQQTPDAGESNFFYNEKAQLRLSRNAQQRKDSRYSYTRYDEQGRVIEVGELETAEDISTLKSALESTSFPQASSLAYVLSDVTRTHYDFAKPGNSLSFVQQYLRTRVAWVEVLEKNTTDTVATYYTYDVHGNVKALLQRQPGLGTKRTEYDYDLVSGKVNHVFYQLNQADQFVHRYVYDADNRLTDVYTSTDRFLWNKEASYFYYNHGPLARTELGAYRSQGVDYYYTLQGWIKGVNQPFADINPNTLDNSAGKDAYSYMLGYFEGDYTPIGFDYQSTEARDQQWTRLNETMHHNGLYNGNISWMTTDLAKLGDVKNDRTKGMHAMLYKYDQLHRITKSRGFNEYSEANGFGVRTTTPYDETYSYDGNGNILALDRMDGLGQLKDNFGYYYYKGSNKLRGVLPIVRDTTYTGAINSNNKLYRDITVAGTSRPQSGIPAELRATRDITVENDFEAEEGMDFAAYIPEDGPFIYDAIGNLIADQEEGSKISWTPYGKVREVKSKNDSVTVKYRYDATGNRIEKKVETWKSTRTTRYVRDASGNVMAIYRDTTVTERPIYGSSRLGEYRGNVPEGTQTLGYRFYELSNHLGNVLTVITDNIHMNTSDTTRAVVATVSDYYPFGLNMKERSWQDTTISKFRYGFNGKEKDDFAFTQNLRNGTGTLSNEGQVSQYNLDGDGTDSGNNGQHGSVQGGPVATTGHDGTANGAIEFDGTDDHIEIADSPDLNFGSDDFTVSIWVKKLSATSNYSNSALVTKLYLGGQGPNEWSLTGSYTGDDNQASFHIESGSTLYSVPSGVEMSLGSWYHLTGMRRGENILIYVNGELKGTTHIGNIAINNTDLPIYIGRVGYGLNTHAAFDDLRIYHRALTDGEVYSLSHEGQSNTSDPENFDDFAETQYDYGFRIYKPSIAKFLSVDPLAKEYPWNGTYAFAENDPINFIDLDGAEKAKIHQGTRALIIVIQGWAGGLGPNREKTQMTNAIADGKVKGPATDGLGSLREKNNNIQLVQFASGLNGYTVNDVKETIKDFNNINPDGRVIMVGHSLGASNALDVINSGEVKNVELLITLDPASGNLSTRGHGPEFVEKNIFYKNVVKNIINYRIDPGADLTFDSDPNRPNSEQTTNGINIDLAAQVRGIQHTNIDNTIAPILGEFIMQALFGDGAKAVDNAEKRNYKTLPLRYNNK